MQSATQPLIFSAIEVADLAGLRRIFPDELGKTGPHLVARIKDMAAFTRVIPDPQCKGRTEFISDSDQESGWLPPASYPGQVITDILSLDQALGFECSQSWKSFFDQTPIDPGLAQRSTDWHQDGFERVYLLASRYGTICLKDTAPKDIKDWFDRIRMMRIMDMGCEPTYMVQQVEQQAKDANLLIEAEPGAIYLMDGGTWHRGQAVPANTPEIDLDRTFMAVVIKAPQP